MLDAAKGFTVFLVKTILFPLLWIWALGVARTHAETDRHARNKVMVACVAGVVLAGAGLLVLMDFQEGATESMYDQMENRLSVAVGEAEYKDQTGLVIAKQGTIDVLQAKVDEASAAGDSKNATIFQSALGNATQEQQAARDRAAQLEPNHALWGRLQPAIDAQEDDKIRALIAGAPFEYEKMDGRTDRAFEIKDKAQADMASWMWWLFLPGLVGVFYAPMSMAIGSVLKNAWEPSDSVGFKPYPGASMGWFLLLGAFGVPALFFATWAFWDMDVRSTTGQISL